MKIKEWFEDSIDWVKDRFQERTSLDGVMLIAIGVIALLFKGLITWAAYAAIIYGVWTLVKSEW